MARVDNNVLTRFSSGAIGKQLVLRNRGTKSFLSNRPKIKKGKRKLSARQAEVRKRFQHSAKYARGIMSDPELRLEYEAAVTSGQTAYNVAFADAFLGPELSDLLTDAYGGNAGDVLTVRAVDNFRVISVKFQLLGANGQELESGMAVLDENSLDWVYTTTTENPAVQGTLIRVTAEDRPKNRALLEHTL